MAKDPDNPFRLSGFGHRVYKNYDPRARILKDACDERAHRARHDATTCSTSRSSSKQVALKDEYFVERKLYPNVDFYSGLIYRAMGFPTQMFTGAVRDRPASRLARALEGDDGEPGHQDRPSAPDLHRRDQAPVRPDRRARLDRRRALAADPLVVVDDRRGRGLDAPTSPPSPGSAPLRNMRVLGVAHRVADVLVGTDHRARGGRRCSRPSSSWS